MTPQVLARIVAENPSCVMLKVEDWPSLEKISALRGFAARAVTRKVQEKLALYSNVPVERVFSMHDLPSIYLLPEVAFNVVNRMQPLRFTASAIGSQLREDGWLVPGNSSNHLTVQMRVQDTRVRLWRLKAAILTGDSGDGP